MKKMYNFKFEKSFFMLAVFVAIMEAAPTNQQTELTQAAPKFNSNFQWTTRLVWHAASARHITPINSTVSGENNDDGGFTSTGVPYVIIHHTATRRCTIGSKRDSTTPTTTKKGESGKSQLCNVTLRAIQRSHQENHGWDDIGYNFLIGSDVNENAEIYEGRGFNVSGAHTIGYNARCIGIALIGNWTDTLPPEIMLQKLKELISYGVKAGYIKSNYKLLGHRQLSATECPGTRFYNELKIGLTLRILFTQR